MLTPWITFDLDGTLVKNPYWRLTLFPWIQKESARRRLDWQDFWQPIADEGQHRWDQGLWVDAYDWSDIIRRVWKEEPPEPSMVPWHQVASLTLPGVLWLLSVLKTYPIRLGIITNGLERNQMPFIKSLGWDQIFDTVVTTNKVTRCKPDPRVFSLFDGPILCHVGDRVHHDVLVACRAQVTSILYQPKWYSEDRVDPLSPAWPMPNHVITHYWGLPKLVTHLLVAGPPASHPNP